MSYPHYPAYKNSGVEWLGAIPAHWEVVRNKVLFHEFDARSTNGGEELLTVSHITGVTPRSEKNVNMIMAETLEGYKKCEIGDLVINTMWAWMGAVGLTGYDGLVSPSYNVYRPRDRKAVNRCYFDYLYRTPAHVIEMTRFSKGIWESRLRLYPDAFASMHSPLPPPNEQAAIAAFLDRETAKIAVLIAKQERLIALLQEKRQALIAYAVTKGLDADAPIKDSGVAWLGEIPAHWHTVHLRRVIENIEQGWSPEGETRLCEDGEWGILKTGCVNKGIFNEMEHKALPPDVQPKESLEVRQGDLLMNRASGSLDLVGSMAYVEACRSRLMLSDKIFRLHTKEDLIAARYLAIAFASPMMRTQIRLAVSGADGLANNIGQASIKQFSLALPPLKEQLAIVARVNGATEDTDALITKAQQSIALLREHRTALIAAAVTGQIDVRGVAGQEEAEERLLVGAAQ